MTPLPLLGNASPYNQQLLKSYKTKPEVEPEGEQHLALSCLSKGDKEKERDSKPDGGLYCN